MFKRIVALFIGWKILLFFFSFLAVFLFPFNPTQGFSLDYLRSSNYFLGIWANFDGANYLNLARDGYSYPNFAYFPLLPFFVSILHKLTFFSFLNSGLLITNLAFFFSLFLFYKLILLDFNQKIAWRTLILLLLFPVSFFYGAVYTESLYFLFATLSFYCARKSRWPLAGIFGLLAGSTRLVGLSLFLALLVEWFWQNKDKNENLNLWKNFLQKKAYFIFLIPLAIIFYGLYLQRNFGDFFLFQKSMAHWGQANFISPPQVFFRYLKILILTPKNIAYFTAFLELFSTFFYFFLGFYVLKKIRFSYGIWMIVSLLIPTFTGTLQSMPRYLLHLFPAFVALALISKEKNFYRIFIFIFILLQFLLVALFTRGYFIA